MPTLLETQAAEIKAKRVANKARLDSKKNDNGDLVMTMAEIEEVNVSNKEIAALVAAHEQQRTLVEIDTKNTEAISAAEAQAGTAAGGARQLLYRGDANYGAKGHDGAAAHRVNFGDLFVESKGYKERNRGAPFSVSMPDIETKNLFATTAGWDPFVSRMPNVILTAMQLPRVVDLFPTGTTTEHAMKFMVETTFTNGATMTAEGGDYGEASLGLTEQTVPVKKIAVFLPVTDEQLDDVPAARDYVDSRLELMLKLRLDAQLVTGDNTGNNLQGINTIPGLQARAQGGTDSSVDTALKALTDVQTVGFAEPSAYLMNPLDWMNIRLLRTADGLYIWGHPSAPGPATLWGLPVVTTTGVTQGTGYVGDWKGYFMLFYRKGVELLVTNSHSDWFIKGKQAIRADMRCALVCFRGAAACKFTGI